MIYFILKPDNTYPYEIYDTIIMSERIMFSPIIFNSVDEALSEIQYQKLEIPRNFRIIGGELSGNDMIAFIQNAFSKEIKKEINITIQLILNVT